MDFIIGLLLGIVVGAITLGYPMTIKVKTHDYSFIMENGKGGGKWVDRAKRYLDNWVERNQIRMVGGDALKQMVDFDRLSIIDELIKLLNTAPRNGAPEDKPEGVRYIQISDTLAKELSRKLRRFAQPEAIVSIPNK